MLILSLCIFTSFLLIGEPAAAESEPPNFVIIYLDDVGYGDLGSYGAEEAKTPNMDRLAEQGTRFTSFYARPLCGPSRGTLMTGRYAHRIGSGWITNAEEVTIAEVLKQAGYTTGCVGKWDMSGRKYKKNLVPNAQGFDYYFGALGANDNGRVTLWRNREKLRTTNDMASLSRLYTNKSIKFIEKSKDEPFFLYLAHTMMHVVIDASPEYRNRTDDGLYEDTLMELDNEIGRLLERLDDLGLRDNTVVLLASDNGPWSNDRARQRAKNEKHVDWTDGPEIAWGDSRPLRGAKSSNWEGGVRVPAIVRWPDQIPAGRTSDAIVSTLDVLPTFAALANANENVPNDRKVDGVNQKNLFLGKNEKGARDRFLYYLTRNREQKLQAVRKGPWKLWLPNTDFRDWPNVDRGTKGLELYNVEQDISEINSVADEHPGVVKRLRKIADEAKLD